MPESDVNYFEKLSRIMKENPDLVFDNDGYERIPIEVRERNEAAIAEVSKLLNVAVHGFVRFDNFKPRKDGSIAVRCQTKWGPHFTGVSYFPLENFTPGHPSWVGEEDV